MKDAKVERERAIKTLNWELAKITASRDKLMQLVSDIERHILSCDSAIDSLEAAIEALQEVDREKRSVEVS